MTPSFGSYASSIFPLSPLAAPIFSIPLKLITALFLAILLIEVGMITGRLISCVLIAYAFARLEAPGKDALFAVLLATLMLPDAVYWIPRFILFSNLGWIDTFLPTTATSWIDRRWH